VKADADLPTAVFALPEGWATASLGELLVGIDAGRSFLCEERPPANDEVGVIKISAVTWGRYDELESKTCTDPELVQERFFISEGDLLISRANTLELVGSCVVATGVTKKIMLSDKVLRLRIRSPFSKEWVLHFLRSQQGRQQIEKLATGNQQSMRNIGQDRLRAIEVPIAPAAEQARIVEKVEALLARIEAARERMRKASAVLGVDAPTSTLGGSIVNAILAKAFAGELVPTEAELARRENRDYEPASTLLERMRQKPTITDGPKKPRTRRH